MSLFGDIYFLERRVKEIDPLLEISYDRHKKEYAITRGKHRVMTVPLGQLDARVLHTLRKNDLHRRRLQDYIWELEQSELEHERRRARELSNQIEAASLDKFDRVAGISHFNVGGIG